MQTKPWPPLRGCEAVIENARQIFRWNSNSIINDGYLDPAITLATRTVSRSVRAPRVIAGVLGVTQPIDQNLQDFGASRRSWAAPSPNSRTNLHAMTPQSILIQAAHAVFTTALSRRSFSFHSPDRHRCSFWLHGPQIRL